MKNVEDLEQKMAEPSQALIDDLNSIDGDILLLGVGGKMGPSIARMAANAVRFGGRAKRVIGVSRFSDRNVRRQLEAAGVETISCDLMNEEQLAALPEARNVIFMAGNKFGTVGREYFTWAMNTYMPGKVAEKFHDSRIVVFSSGNLYPLTKVGGGGADESVPPEPVGEYGQSCLGRERIFEYFAREHGTPMLFFRLNYAVEMRYGVLLEIAKAVHEERAIDLTMGHANVIWQGDAAEMALRSLTKCANPPQIVNITGPETISVRWAAGEFAKRLGKQARFTGTEADTALLSNASKSYHWFGYPRVPLLQMIDWIAEWIQAGGITWDKATYFQEREGRF
ncbi:hypothetical protein PAE9249_01710 [Paenibacillus sp. CECT 9249]|uniref:NAD-dependent epimerase/dehydratase family protein n=1 Tax=Paenibacillus sp. CECT 9249 TaxID=2845385 RepID=UPI001E3D3241|nr:NAD-dependent epimerase/dehydratase family protein [Paenibacillus sp. CECT 9249]CAH0119211.1 hypothetical protein PAE9249_01710 [Paenibacillus sp. CECT 9249]